MFIAIKSSARLFEVFRDGAVYNRLGYRLWKTWTVITLLSYTNETCVHGPQSSSQS